MMYGFYNMMNWGGFGWLFNILFIGLLFIGGIELIRYISRSDKNNSSSKDKSPVDILKERYAKGEINKKEYEEKKRDLLQ